SFKANFNPATVGSVRFGFQVNPNYSVDNVPPYALGGDNSGNYNNMTFGVGTYAVTATPFQNANATGLAGTPLSLTFRIVPAGGLGLRTSAEQIAGAHPTSETKDEELATLLPSPAQRQVFIRIVAKEAGECSIEMVSSLGKRTYTGTHRLAAGTHVLAFELEPSQYPAGVYFVSAV